MRHIWIILISLSLLLIGCAPLPPTDTSKFATPDILLRPINRTVHGDTRFNREERMLIEAAATAIWNFTQGRARFAIVWDWDETSFVRLASELHISRTPTDVPKAATLDIDSGGRVLGYYKDPEIGIFAERAPEFYPVALHELAHAAGMDHVYAYAVMNRGDPAWNFTNADYKECVRVGMCAPPQ